jgi:hypothetical protein
VAGDGTVPARSRSLAVEGDEVVHLAWTVSEDPAANVRLVTSTNGGITFGSPTTVAASDGHADAPKLAVDREGTVHVVYAEADRGSGGRYHIHYTRRSSGDDAFEVVRVISCTDANGVDSVGFPSLSVDGEGTLYVVWERFPTRRGRPLGLGFAHSEDGGRTFGGYAVVPGTADGDLGFNGGLQGLLTRKLAVAEDGAIAVANSSFRQGEASLVRLILGRVERAASLTE